MASPCFYASTLLTSTSLSGLQTPCLSPRPASWAQPTNIHAAPNPSGPTLFNLTLTPTNNASTRLFLPSREVYLSGTSPAEKLWNVAGQSTTYVLTRRLLRFTDHSCRAGHIPFFSSSYPGIDLVVN